MKKIYHILKAHPIHVALFITLFTPVFIFTAPVPYNTIPLVIQAYALFQLLRHLRKRNKKPPLKTFAENTHYYGLFQYFAANHALVLNDDELEEIIMVVGMWQLNNDANGTAGQLAVSSPPPSSPSSPL